ncbi:MAG: trypsin-like peptidase domain-containing protein [Candidatus Pacebacteria bacterium]|nr:trypsin-like peptidase domain-containing protein [Candidatus Paceibacterota bacterium]
MFNLSKVDKPLVLESELSELGSQEVTQVLKEESAVISVVERVSPAVVSIVASRDLSNVREDFSPQEEYFFREFFGEDFNSLFPSNPDSGSQEVSSGSGFIISSDGYIVTNGHVVDDPSLDYSVVLSNETTYEAKVLDVDPITDLAVLKIEASDLPTVELGESSELKVGQTVIAIGNALGEFSNTVSTGVISGLSRSVVAGSFNEAEQLINVIQTDASINPGNSGGPLLDISGKVIGINTAIVRGAQNIGFAIPVDSIKGPIDSVKETGEIVRPWLGVRYINISDSFAQKNNLEVDKGALIARGDNREDLAVMPGSPADKAGLRENDIILEVNGEEINEKKPLVYLISKYSPEDKITLTILRQGEKQSLEVVLGSRDN